MASLQPINEPYSPEIAKLLERYPHQDGYLLALFRTFANSRRFLQKGVANLLDRDSPLPLRQREIVILRVTANLDCEYEWGVHVAVFAGAASLSDQQVAATRLEAPDAACWNETEGVLLRIVDELCNQGRVSDATSPLFNSKWSLEQQLEILALCGNYHTVSFVANTARLPMESFAACFPS